MRVSISGMQTRTFCSFPSLTNTNQNQTQLTNLSFKYSHERPAIHRLFMSRKVHGTPIGCAKWGPGTVTEEIKEIGEDWVVDLGKSGEKCKGREGVVEMLECLEKEAIMGDDEGRDPNDYNRRAQIFDRSSRVFQALKEEDTVASSSHKT